MIERSKIKANNSKRDRAAKAKKKRRLTMEGLEARQLLAGDIYLPDVDFNSYNGPRNVGAVQALQLNEREQINESGKNDVIAKAELIPLGNGPGQNDTIDLRGAMQFSSFTSTRFSADIDTFAFDLEAGDILDISAFGTAGTIDLYNPDGTFWVGAETPTSSGTPSDSPIQTVGNATLAQVIPTDGRYFLTVTPLDTSSNYLLGLRTYRPQAEQLPVGVGQVIFLDMDGGYYPRSLFEDVDPATGLPPFGIVRVPSLQESLPLLGIETADTAALNELIDKTIAEIERHFAHLGLVGNAGDYDSTGNRGDFGITVLNSRDHADPGSHPLVTRVHIGGDNPDDPGLLGKSSTLDVGNFSMDDIVFALAAPILPAPVPISPTVSQLDYASDILAFIVTHEAIHSFGMRHTDPFNTTISISDAVVASKEGNDGIYGTLDDEPCNLVDDVFGGSAGSEGLIGFNYVVNGMANTLVTGLVGGTVAGTVFNDFNRDGSRFGDAGLPGFNVFADLNANGSQDAGEPSTTSDAQGNYSLDIRSGTFDIIAEGLNGFAATTNPVQSTTVTTGQTSVVNFGFAQVIADITGTAFVDSDGNGIRDAGEPGLEGVYVYADLDGDDRPDLGEPGAFSNDEGSYSINFPGAGTYTLRSDLEPGYERTFPVGEEHTFTYDGLTLDDNYDFGFLPSLDFGDAPDSYGTSVSADGARHGITEGLSIGSSVDREGDGLPSVAGTGDDVDNLDDEDGVRLLSPLGPGASATFEVTATNTTGSNAYLQGFMDFNQDGVFGIGEQFALNVPVVAGTIGKPHELTVDVPEGVDPGTTFVRFRLSQTSSVGATGFASTGEVEDHAVQILTEAKVANDDTFSVPRNSLSNMLPVLENDFQNPTNPIQIDSFNYAGAGVVVNGVDRLFYTPPNGFTGREEFTYTVVDALGNRSSASVVVNVTFQSDVPIALDDVFEVPQGSSNRALNVLDNDVASIHGGLSITSVTGGSAGGTVTVVGGGQSLRYTPDPDHTGTEQFTYSIQDSAGSTSNATVTVNMLPGSPNDDVVEFSIEVLDPLNNREVTNVRVGDEVLVKVYVDDLRLIANIPGVAAAFTDLLYTDELLSTTNTDSNPAFPFDITFGSLFTGLNTLQTGDAQVPGLINEVGAVQRIDNQTSHIDRVELFTVKMQATSPGVAVFQTDPADESISETVVLGSDEALTVSQLRLGSAELLILPDTGPFTAAVDDSFPEGLDSDGNLISNSFANANRLDILGNDNLGPTGNIREFGILTNPAMGTVTINDNGTPDNLNDDYVDYRAAANADGLDSFTYLIVTDDNVRSTAEVTIALGAQNNNAQVGYDFTLVSGDGSGTEISSVNVGERFGIEIRAEDLRMFTPTFVFAGFLDVLYDSDRITPADTRPSDNFDFDVDFHGDYSTGAAVGTAATPGIIDEFGTLFSQASIPASQYPSLNPGLIATIYFNAVGAGLANVIGSPADASPFQDTLLFDEDDPIHRSLLKFETFEFVIGSGAPNQNSSLNLDVNDDGFVSPIDALLVINEMNRSSMDMEGEQTSDGKGKRYYTDVNGDNRTTALDALKVINYLKRTSSTQSSGEQISLLSDSNDSFSSNQSGDAYFAELASDDSGKIASFDSASSGGTNPIGNGSADSSMDEDEDIYSALADDVDGQWA